MDVDIVELLILKNLVQKRKLDNKKKLTLVGPDYLDRRKSWRPLEIVF